MWGLGVPGATAPAYSVPLVAWSVIYDGPALNCISGVDLSINARYDFRVAVKLADDPTTISEWSNACIHHTTAPHKFF